MAAPASASTAAAMSTTAASASAAPASQQFPPAGQRRIEDLVWDNRSLRVLPVDPETRIFPRQVSGACFSLVEPTPVQNPQLVAYSAEALRWIELGEAETQRADFAEYFSGNKILPGARPAAHCYCGHQFGHFSGQLGDGATMYLGEIVTSTGERVEIQFKGAGATPYSRRADGRKVLRSSIREFLCSEAHAHLGIPTTRAGTLVTSDTKVVRDIFYSGNEIQERATVITRLAPTFLRFGSFEIAKTTDSITGRAGPSPGRTDLIAKLLDYVMDSFYKEQCAHLDSREEKCIAFFRELTRRTAHMVAKWQSVGWCHGVLNTDNMSIVGLTIDYGPFGFMESFDPDYICNNSDTEGRYAYARQPEICGWNLLKLSQNLEPFAPRARLRAVVEEYENIFHEEYNRLMRLKLGLGVYSGDKEAGEGEKAAASPSPAAAAAADAAMDAEEEKSVDSEELVDNLLETMAATGSDFTNSFRALGRLVPGDKASFEAVLAYLVSQCASIATRVAALAPRIPEPQLRMIQQLMVEKPEVFQRPGMEEQLALIEAELARARQRDEVRKQSQQEKEAEDAEHWRAWLESYNLALQGELAQARHRQPDRSVDELVSLRRRVQNSHNPKYILRNWIAQTVIDAAEKGDYSVVGECLQRLRDPYDVEDRGEQEEEQRERQQQPAEEGAAAAAGSDAAASATSPAALEEEATHLKPHAPSSERDERAKTTLPPKGTQCAIHWNKERPAWASGLKVT